MWQIQRGRLPRRLRLPLCQYHLQHQYLSEPLLFGYVLALHQRRPETIQVGVSFSKFLLQLHVPTHTMPTPRPVPKFLCVKGILFFSFWQSIGISLLVAAGAITKLGPYTDSEHISLALIDTLICLEMPFFAFAHMFAFSFTDFIDPYRSYVARMPMYYAFRDAFGLLDVVEDSKSTLRGEGMDYREFEPSEGYMHQGAGRDRRIRAGLRYSKGGKRKYWLPKPSNGTQPPGRIERGVNRAVTTIAGRDQGADVHAPLLVDDAEDVTHLAPDMLEAEEPSVWGDSHAENGYELPFGDLDEGDEELFSHCKKYLFGDYNYPCIDVSSEDARTTMWDEEERVLRDERGAWFSPIRGSKGQVALEQREGPAWEGYGAVGTTLPRNLKGKGNRPYHDHEDARIIDFEQDRVPPAQPTDVQLKWTKKRRGQGSRSASQSQSPHLRNLPGLQAESPSSPSSAESSSSAANRIQLPSSRPRTNSRTLGSPTLPPDAVDLIVEDRDAAQEERTRERRKGEPTVRGSALRKVYRRGFVAPSGDGGRTVVGEVEVEDPDEGDAEVPVDIGEEIREAMEDHGKATERANEIREVPRVDDYLEAERIAAKPEDPSLHARTFVDKYAVLGDENPWA